jgi:hypothetical protein
LNCPFCGKEAEWTENKAIYGRNYGKSYMCYLCRPYGAYVGCHQNTRNPLGTMANKELREWRVKAHAVIDPLWKSGKMKRKEVYKLIQEKLGRWIHIGESTIEDCKEVIKKLTGGGANE